jgi:adenylate cyclase, class 1
MSSPPKLKIAPDFSDGVDRKLLNRVRDRFLRVNADRLQKTYDGLSSREQDILKLIPFLYQVNHPLIPGYVSRSTPRGVSGYLPDKEALSIAAGFSKTFRFRPDRRHVAQIQSIFMMGSTGTLAHSESSDVDLWLCIDPSVSEEQEALLKSKSEAIDRWANEQGLELHTFVMCAERFKNGNLVPSMDSESSGSAQHFLLLDEFYRTAILIAGRYPMWWLIPPALEGDYDATAELLLSKRFVKEKEVLDFGCTAYIPKSELIGAGLWQLYKSLDSPYKSTLKLLLAEVYARELPEYPCLSVEFKQAVYDDNLETDQLDPYFLLYLRLENYLVRAQEVKRLELVRKSFYLKVNKKLSQAVRGRKISWQRKLLRKQVTEWRWADTQIKHLDDRRVWKVSDVLEERQELLNELTNAYRFLTSYARSNNISSSITNEDMNLLGRKLYAIFQRKAGKVERVNPGIAPNLWEESVAIHHASSQEFVSDQNAWFLYTNLDVASDASFKPPLRKMSNLIELLAWLYFNDILSRSTRLSVVPGTTELSVQEVSSAIATLEEIYPKPLPKIPQSAFTKAPLVQNILLIVNLGVNPLAIYTEGGVHRLSDRTDSLSYSSQRYNLVKTIDQVVMNSWGEVSAVRYEVGETLLQNLQAYLQLCLDQSASPFSLQVRCFGKLRSDQIAKRVSKLFEEAKAAFFSSGQLARKRYVVEIENGYYLIVRNEDQFRFQRIDDKDALMSALSSTEGGHCPIVLDSYALCEDEMLKATLPLNKMNCIQVFYRLLEKGFEVCVINEHGSVLKHYSLHEDEAVFQSALFSFVSTIVERRQLSGGAQGLLSLEFYTVRGVSAEDFKIAQVKRIPLLALEQVLALGQYSTGDLQFDLSYQNRDFSFREYGEQQVAALIDYFKSQKTKQRTLPIKVVDLNFPADPMGIQRQNEQGFGTLDYVRNYFALDDAIKRALAPKVEQQS